MFAATAVNAAAGLGATGLGAGIAHASAMSLMNKKHNFITGMVDKAQSKLGGVPVAVGLSKNSVRSIGKGYDTHISPYATNNANFANSAFYSPQYTGDKPVNNTNNFSANKLTNVTALTRVENNSQAAAAALRTTSASTSRSSSFSNQSRRSSNASSFLPDPRSETSSISSYRLNDPRSRGNSISSMQSLNLDTMFDSRRNSVQSFDARKEVDKLAAISDMRNLRVNLPPQNTKMKKIIPPLAGNARMSSGEPAQQFDISFGNRRPFSSYPRRDRDQYLSQFNDWHKNKIKGTDRGLNGKNTQMYPSDYHGEGRILEDVRRSMKYNKK